MPRNQEFTEVSDEASRSGPHIPGNTEVGSFRPA